MKIIALGDTHGRTDWKIISAKNDFDKIVFIGDYFDTHENISPDQQKDNFKDLIAYKKANMDKVVLLFGNHDYHYLSTTEEIYSGFQMFHKTDIQEMIHEAISEDLLCMCFIWKNIIFTHAGVTKTWCNTNLIQKEFLEQSINDLFKYKPNAFRFTSGKNRDQYGDDICQTPIWVRPNSLLVDGIDDYIQVVGHTVQDKLVVTNNVILIDTLGTSGEYLQIIDGVISSIK
jgi:predicted MPP superfamily phosphohydrolase